MMNETYGYHQLLHKNCELHVQHIPLYPLRDWFCRMLITLFIGLHNKKAHYKFQHNLTIKFQGAHASAGESSLEDLKSIGVAVL